MADAQPPAVPAPMSKGEREALLKMVRQRERVAKRAAEERSAQLLAEFEAQLDRRYSYDEDAVWNAITEQVKKVTEEAHKEIARRSEELGIPPEFAPNLSCNWYGRGRNAMKDERAEMRRVAKRRIEQIETSAKLAIENASVKAQEQILLDGITSDSAKGFIAQIPTVEQLMPVIALEEVQAKLASPKRLGGGQPGYGEIEQGE